jgi:hypothetical protein
MQPRVTFPNAYLIPSLINILKSPIEILRFCTI